MIWFRKLIQYLDHHLSKNVYRMILISSWYSFYILTLCALLPNWNDFLFFCTCNVNILTVYIFFWHGCFLLRIVETLEKFSHIFFLSHILFLAVFGTNNFQSDKKMSKMSSIKAHGMVTWDSSWGVFFSYLLDFFMIIVKYLLSKLSYRRIYFFFLIFFHKIFFFSKLFEKLPQIFLVLSLFLFPADFWELFYWEKSFNLVLLLICCFWVLLLVLDVKNEITSLILM